ncbi:MAG: sigma 54-interacting transcriptional regulator [Thermodesulfobacteriota bacterium]
MDLVVDVAPIKDIGQVHGAVITFQQRLDFEATAQKLKSYNHLNTQLKAIFEFSSDGIWVSDGKGTVLRINKASEKLNGIKSQDVVGKNIMSVVEQGIIDDSVTLRVLAAKRPVNMLQYVSRTQKHLLLTGIPFFDEEGNISLVVVNERDMTQLNEVKEQLEQARQVSEKFKDKLKELRLQELREELLIAESKEMRRVIQLALKLSHLDVSNILLLGESGSGKGFLAKFIHSNSSRSDKSFIQVNCAALPETLIEAELFGYEEGAFTGARKRGKPGLFELAQGGTLFLDEVGEAPLSIQAKLLKYLDDYEVLRLGGTQPVKIDCTIITATNQDLEAKVKKGAFRKDLFYRLNTFTLSIPPLRNRVEDIFALATYFVAKYNKRYDLDKKITPGALHLLQHYPFPGNIRELKAMIKKAVVMSEKDVLDEQLLESLEQVPGMRPGFLPELSPRMSLPAALRKIEKELLHQALKRCKSTREMASCLGVSQPTVVRKLKAFGLSR